MTEPSITDWAARIMAGDRRALALAITLTESQRIDHRTEADALLNLIWSRTGHAIRIAISGPPGVGKSTFIETLGTHALAAGRRIAVLAIDPSSRLSGGSILGDKTRMETLTRHANAYIRPSPAGETLGGVARRTREAIALCEAAGFDLVIIETIGVGQSELTAANMVDMFILLLAPAGGDDLQGIKRGIVEIADLLLINKSDGDLEIAAKRSETDYANALRLLRPVSTDWQPQVHRCSALTGYGIDIVWSTILAHATAITTSGERDRRRCQQDILWFREELRERLLNFFEVDPSLRLFIPRIEEDVRRHILAPPTAAQRILNTLPLPRER
ncbi:MAG: methylmalonyl Co-A mutase-associated GTPase MeaB [Alphaproteobacteria bacterium]